MNTTKLDQAVGLHQEGKFDDAEEIYLEILVDEPENAEVLKLLGVMALQQGKSEEGISYIEAAIEIAPEASEYHLALGRAYFHATKYEDGINAAKRAGELDPGRADVFATLGYFFQHIQNFPQARAAYERAAVIDPDNLNFKVGAGLSAYFAGQADVASEYLTKAYEKDNSIHQAGYGLALLKADAGDIQGAREYVSKAITLEPDNPEYARLLAQLSEENPESA